MGTVWTAPGTVHSTPERNPRSGFYWWKMGGWNPRDGMPFRGDSDIHTSETARSRVHVEAENERGGLGIATSTCLNKV